MSNIKIHPKDHRVAIVSCLDDFTAVADKPYIEAIIVRRPKAEITAIKKQIRQAFKTAEDLENIKWGIVYTSTINPKTNQPQTKLASGRPPKTVRDALKQEAKIFAQYWYAGSHKSNITDQILLNAAPSPEPHPHDYFALTCVWNTKKGTAWAPPGVDREDPKNHTLRTKEGDLFFMKPGFYHASPPAAPAESKRLLFACMPQKKFV